MGEEGKGEGRGGEGGEGGEGGGRGEGGYFPFLLIPHVDQHN